MGNHIRMPPFLDKRLIPFQKKGVKSIYKKKGRALLADDMGLGKTVQALAYARIKGKGRPLLIICPASVKIYWQREAKKWLRDKRIKVIDGRGLQRVDADVLIVNYETLSEVTEKGPGGKRKKVFGTGWVRALQELKPSLVVLDECQYIKKRKSLRTSAVRRICRNAKRVIALSGTPIENGPVEFFPVLNILRPDLFPSFWDYAQAFCNPRWNGFGYTYGAANVKELRRILKKHLMIRRRKSQVLKDLPQKVRAVVPIEIENDAEYETKFQSFMDNIDRVMEMEEDEQKQHIERIKQLCVQGKMRSATEWIQDFLQTGEKLVVFCTHRKVVDHLCHKFRKVSVRVDGSVVGEKRQLAVDRFQSESSVRLLVGNLRAAGVGLTLTAASNTCFIELGWTPSAHDQAEDRVHRIGQEADSVTAWYLIGAGTIEEDIVQLLDRKRRILTQIMDGKKVKNKKLLGMLLRRMKHGMD